MNTNRIMSLVIFCVLLFQAGCASFSRASTNNLKGPIGTGDMANQSVEPVEVVKKLLSAAAEKNTEIRDELMAPPPESFYNSDCVQDGQEKKVASGAVHASAAVPTRNDPLYSSTKESLEALGQKKLRIDEVALERIMRDEAIVRIVYYDPTDTISVETFSLLYRRDGEWKVFLIAANPGLINEHYAADRCQPAPKLTNIF
ncbi:MAG TPA: hypothetical protein VFQ43_02645, partial [Nitrososphaera sp.]|nr:hypothetical protein [Nitrososphaera sp.]